MALRYRKSVKLGKGVKLNVGKKSVGLSFGGKLGGVSFNSRSGARVRASAPGTGLSYTKKVGGNVGKKKLVRDFEDFAAPQEETEEQTVERFAPEEAPKKKKRTGLKIFGGLVLLIAIIGSCGGNDEKPVVTPEPTEKIVETAAPKETPVPTDEVEETPAPTQKPNETEAPEKTPAPTQTPKETEKPEKTPAPTAKPTAKPQKDTPVVVPSGSEDEDGMVWIPTNGGTKYHSKSTCSGMDDPQYVSVSKAESLGFTPCKRCYG